MKLLKLALFLLVVCGAAACEDEEDMMPVCTQADWVGSYTGTSTCEGQDPSDVTVTISASGTDQVRISTQEPNVTTTYDPITIDGCSGELMATQGNITASVNITLDGDNFTLRDVLMGGSFNQDCTVTATRD